MLHAVKNWKDDLRFREKLRKKARIILRDLVLEISINKIPIMLKIKIVKT